VVSCHWYGINNLEDAIMTGRTKADASATVVDTEASFIERIAEKMGITAGTSLVYGEPVEDDGITIIPVTRIRYGFGGGPGEGEGGSDGRKHGSGSGGGGGLSASPAGYIEIRDGESTFRPIHDRTSLALMVVAGGVAGLLLLRGIATIMELRANVDTE
jgi:uncharacterized spore protein YtfJ